MSEKHIDSGNQYTDVLLREYEIIRSNPHFQTIKDLIESKIARAMPMLALDPLDERRLNTPPKEQANLNFKVRKQDLPYFNPLTGERSPHFVGDYKDEGEINCNFQDCWDKGDFTPIVQLMLDMLHEDYQREASFSEDPINEVPDRPELFVSRDWLETRAAHPDLYIEANQGETELSDLATEAFFWNIQHQI